VKKRDPIKAKKAKNKIQKMLEFDERLKTAKNFVKCWNDWRAFYLELPPLEVKTKGQLTVIENCIEWAKLRDIDINMLIACVHRAYQKRKFKPGFDEILKRGDEHWQLYPDVIADLEKDEAEKRAMDV
jgi:hypothetical protein